MLSKSRTCQGITPSNSKGGLPAPEAGTRAQEGNNYKLSKLSKQSEELSRQSSELRGEQDQEAPLKKEARVGVIPKSLTRLRNTSKCLPSIYRLQKCGGPTHGPAHGPSY